VRRNSLRSLRELRSDRAPQARSTKRASRADPEAALLGAADIAAAGLASARRRAPWAHAGQPPKAALDASVVLGSKGELVVAGSRTLLASTVTVSAKVRAVGRGRASCAAEKHRSAGLRAPSPPPSTVNCLQGTERRRRKKSNERSLPDAFTSMHIGNHP
jgi:hypothetical protein